MQRAVFATLVVALFLTGCTASEPEVAAEKTSAKADEPRPKAPKLVQAKSVDSVLNVGHVQGCLYEDQVTIDQIAGQYYGPQDLVAGEVELTRGIDFTVPGEVKMVEKPEFADELKQTITRFSRKEQKVNRWLEWNLGYRPYSRKADPAGIGTDRIAGFYDSRSQEVVVQQEGELDAEYIVLAHEFAHAAVDQNFGLRKKYSPLAIDDKELAYDALVEGDATLAEFRFGSRLGDRGIWTKVLKDLLTSKVQFKKDGEAGVPYAATDRFVFPYRWGLAFACSVFRKGGWEAVDRAHSKPPTSTAEVMFPERFIKGQRPEEPAPLKAPGKQWKVFAKGTIGAAHLKALFEAPADVEFRALGNALGRAAAWNGGSYRLWARELGSVNSVMGVSLVEHPQHKGVLCSSMMKWYEKTFSTADRTVLKDDVVSYEDALRSGVIDCRGRDVKIGIGPELSQAQKVVGL